MNVLEFKINTFFYIYSQLASVQQIMMILPKSEINKSQITTISNFDSRHSFIVSLCKHAFIVSYEYDKYIYTTYIHISNLIYI
jgi:hypothetical protein